MLDETRQTVTLKVETFQKLVNLGNEMGLTYDQLAEKIVNSYADKAAALSHAVKIKSQLRDRNDKPDTTPLVNISVALVENAEIAAEEIDYLHENNMEDFESGKLQDALRICAQAVANLNRKVREYLG